MSYSINLSFVSEIDTLLSQAQAKNTSNGGGEGVRMDMVCGDHITRNFFVVIFKSHAERVGGETLQNILTDFLRVGFVRFIGSFQSSTTGLRKTPQFHFNLQDIERISGEKLTPPKTIG